MNYQDLKYNTYVEILKEELVPAMGCTEPIAIAFCASNVREVLGHIPSRIEVYASGNIIKNVKSVIVPHTNGNHGIEAAVGIGILAGNSNAELEVIAKASQSDIDKLPSYLANTPISVKAADTTHALYIEVIGYYKDEYARVIVRDSHTHIYLIEKNNQIIYKNKVEIKTNVTSQDKTLLNVKDIIEFADIVDINDVKKTLDRQIKYNMAIANEGIKNNYGANVGKTILKYGKNDKIQFCLFCG